MQSALKRQIKKRQKIIKIVSLKGFGGKRMISSTSSLFYYSHILSENSVSNSLIIHIAFKLHISYSDLSYFKKTEVKPVCSSKDNHQKNKKGLRENRVCPCKRSNLSTILNLPF